MNYKIIDAVSPEGVEFQYLLVDDVWQVPMTEENPMYLAYLNKDKAEQSTPNLPGNADKL
jgi:hypothetical protein